MKVVVTGASGLIGRHLVAALRRRGDDVVALSRRPQTIGGVTATVWNPDTDVLAADVVAGAAAIVNLAGTGIGEGRWNASHRREILESRVTVTRRVVAALATSDVAVLVSASAIGYYGPTDNVVDESAPSGDDFLASVCVAWEKEALAAAPRTRVVLLRTGMVLARDGGALPRMALPARLGVGGRLGSGKQVMSWIHIDDEIAAIIHAIDNGAVKGPVNAVAPAPVQQRHFAKVLGRALHRPSFMPTPGFAIRVAIGGSAELALTGQRVAPGVLEATGFSFAFPSLESALSDLLAKPGSTGPPAKAA